MCLQGSDPASEGAGVQTQFPSQFLPALPTLNPLMFLRPPIRAGETGAEESDLFPFDHPGWKPFFYGRNAVWHSMKLFAIQRGDRVLMPIYHHGVEVEAILASGAEVDFFRIHPDLTADLSDIRAKLNERTRVLYIIHYLGFPQPVDELARFAREHGLKLVEDCALALFSSFAGKWLGSAGDAAIFSLHKTLPVPNGGGLLVNDPALFGEIETVAPPLASTMSRTMSSALDHVRLRMPGAGAVVSATARGLGRGLIRKANIERTPVGGAVFDATKAGWGMSEISRLVIDRSDAERIVSKRRENYLLLARLLGEHAWLPNLPEGVCPLFFPLWVEEKEPVIKTLARFGIEAVNFWLIPHSKVPAGDVVTDSLRQHLLELPCHQDLDPEHVHYVAKVLLAQIID